MAIQPIFSGGQLPANVVSAQSLPRGVADAAPAAYSQIAQAQVMRRELDESADQVPSRLPDVGSTSTYDVHARVEPTPGDGRRPGRHFDERA